MITPQALYDVIDRTWPAASKTPIGAWTIRDGQGGGKRASAATGDGRDDIEAAEAAMRALNQTPLFMIRAGDNALDTALDDRGYQIIDPTNAYAIATQDLTDLPIPRVTAFAIWEPLAIMEEIWAKGGVGPARLKVMARAETKTAIFARWNEKPAGAGFVAIHEGVAMVHAVEVLAHQRRQGVGQWIMRRAAHWAQEHGASKLTLLTTADNGPANALYQRLGFARLPGYHYRILRTKGGQP